MWFLPFVVGGAHIWLQGEQLPGVHGEPGAALQSHGADRHEEHPAHTQLMLSPRDPSKLEPPLRSMDTNQIQSLSESPDIAPRRKSVCIIPL